MFFFFTSLKEDKLWMQNLKIDLKNVLIGLVGW